MNKNGRRIKKLRVLAQDPKVDLWALDEVHFQQHGSRCQMWVPPEITDPVCLHHPTRKSVGYFGAVRLRDGKLLIQREENKFNGQTFWNFLQQLEIVSKRKGQKIALITDNARYHHAKMHRLWRQQHAPMFTLNYLPPYSPDFNPIERVWKLTRKLRIHDQYFSTLTDVIVAVEDQFAQWREKSETLRMLCTI